jgi:hypothetical protein
MSHCFGENQQHGHVEAAYFSLVDIRHDSISVVKTSIQLISLSQLHEQCEYFENV